MSDDFLSMTAQLVGVFLKNQIIFVTTLSKKASLEDDWASGYVLGAIDATLQHSLVEQESEEGLALITATIATIYEISPQAAFARFHEWIAKQDDPDFNAGMLCGGTQMQRALNKETTGIMGLAYYLAKGIKADTLK